LSCNLFAQLLLFQKWPGIARTIYENWPERNNSESNFAVSDRWKRTLARVIDFNIGDYLRISRISQIFKEKGDIDLQTGRYFRSRKLRGRRLDKKTSFCVLPLEAEWSRIVWITSWTCNTTQRTATSMRRYIHRRRGKDVAWIKRWIRFRQSD